MERPGCRAYRPARDHIDHGCVPSRGLHLPGRLFEVCGKVRHPGIVVKAYQGALSRRAPLAILEATSVVIGFRSKFSSSWVTDLLENLGHEVHSSPDVGVTEYAGAVTSVCHPAGGKPSIVQGPGAVGIQLPGFLAGVPNPLHAFDQCRQSAVEPVPVTGELEVPRRGPLDHALIHQPDQGTLLPRSPEEAVPVGDCRRVRGRNALPVKIRSRYLLASSN